MGSGPSLGRCLHDMNDRKRKWVLELVMKFLQVRFIEINSVGLF